MPTTASVQQILPQLEHRITDWRTYQPKKLTIAPYADLAMEFEMTSVRQEGGRTIWTGRNVLNGAFLVTVATQNEWHAVLEVPAASNFEFHISGQSATVTETDATVLCGNERLVASAAVAGETIDANSTPTDNSTALSAGDVHTVDVLFFYDTETLTANNNNAQQVEISIVAMVEAANRVLENSKVDNLRWRYVAAYQVPDYTATDKLKNDLEQLTFTDNAVGQFAAEKCALHGVDQAMLLVSKKRSDDYSGLAWVPGQGSIAHHAVMVWGGGYVVLAHELAHNFGCRHDRQTEMTATGEGFGFGFRFSLDGKDTGTIMSYAPTRVPYFSNPELEYAGVRLGLPEGQASVTNNSRLLRENALAMAVCREATEAPVIIAQPQPARVIKGVGFSLSVTAVGDGLTYQWRKDGVALSGATDPFYAKPSASTGDVGTYDVVVGNIVGETSSASAAVAVYEPTASSGVSSSSSSGGQSGSATGSSGGGGAVEPWVLVAFALLGALRLIGRARRNR
ncbi:MAG: hypothetical protein IPP19_09255 [Verrucomicrobia bacterium]|nr:hypothetical protein [Verrucomicrobiota bacterium]